MDSLATFVLEERCLSQFIEFNIGYMHMLIYACVVLIVLGFNIMPFAVVQLSVQ